MVHSGAGGGQTLTNPEGSRRLNGAVVPVLAVRRTTKTGAVSTIGDAAGRTTNRPLRRGPGFSVAIKAVQNQKVTAILAALAAVLAAGTVVVAALQASPGAVTILAMVLSGITVALVLWSLSSGPGAVRRREETTAADTGTRGLLIGADLTDQTGTPNDPVLAGLLRSLIGAIDVAVLIYDDNDRLVLANEKAQELFPNVEQAIASGMTFPEIAELSVQEGHVKLPGTPKETWVRTLKQAHADPGMNVEVETRDGRWVRIRNQKIDGGWTVGLRVDITEEKKRERALVESEERLGDLSRVSSDWHWEMDAELRFTYLSERIEDITGLPPSYFLGKTRRDVMSQESLPQWESHFADLNAHRPFRDFRYSTVTPDGRRRHFTLSGTPVFDTEGRFAGYRGAATDITDAQESEEAAQVARSRLTDAIEALSAVIMLFDSQGRLELFNSRATYLYGQAGRPIQRGMKIRDVLRIVADSGIVAEAKGKEHDWTNEETARLTRADGERVMRHVGDVWLQCRAYRTQDGGLLSVETDVTPMVHREQKLQRQSSMLRVVMDSMAQGIAAYDSSLKLLAWNRRYVEILDLPPKLLRVGTQVDAIIRNSGIGTMHEGKEIEEVIAERKQRLMRFDGKPDILHLPSGDILQVEAHPLEGGGVLVSVSDITVSQRNAEALTKAKEEAELANRSKSHFLANITHELRTPLNAIIGFAEVLRDELFGPLGNKQYQDFVIDIHESGRHLLSLINDILDLSKYEIGHRELQAHPMELAVAVEASIRIIRQRAIDKNLTLIDEVPRDLPPISAESRAVRQILINLLSNAIKFTPAGGKVTVAADRVPGGTLALSVSDTGIGIAPEDIPRAFAPFEQIDSDLTREFEGTGLGLPLVKSLAELHGADVRMETEVGKGTTVTVEFPKDRVLTRAKVG